MTKAARVAFVLALLACLGCGGSGGDAPGHDLTGTWEIVDAACTSETAPEDLEIPSGLPPEALEAIRELVSPAHWEVELEGPVRFVQTGDMLEIFDAEEEEAPLVGTITDDRLAYALSQDGLSIAGEGAVVSPGALEIDHVLTFEEMGAVVSCGFDAVRL